MEEDFVGFANKDSVRWEHRARAFLLDFSLSEVGMKVFFKEDFQEEMEEGRGTGRERDRGVMKRNNERVK